MKTKSLYIILSLFAFLVISCGDSIKEFPVKNSSTNFVGDLNGYLEVVNGNYNVVRIGSSILLTVKLKAIKQEKSKEFDEIRAELVDENGMPITGASSFVLAKTGWLTTERENTKIDNALKDGQGEFAVQFIYDTYSTGGGSLSISEFMETASKKAKVFSIVSSKFKEGFISTSGVSASNSTSNTIKSSSESKDTAWETLVFKNYSIDYPADVRIDKIDQEGTFKLYLGDKDNITMVIEDLAGEILSFDDYVEQYRYVFFQKTNVTGFQSQRLVINTQACQKYCASFDDGHGEIEFKCMVYIWVKNNWGYNLVFTASPDSFDKLLPTAKKIMGSLKFTKK